MTREPDPLRNCRPGGSCPDCNARPPVCGWCGETPVENEGEKCERCETAERSAAEEDAAADKRAVIAYLRKREEAARRALYLAEADLYEAEGDVDFAAWKRADAADDKAAAHAAWVRGMARKMLSYGQEVEPDSHGAAEIAAEMERMRAALARGEQP